MDGNTAEAGAYAPAVDEHRQASIRRIRSIIQQSPTSVRNPYGVTVDPHGLAEKIEADNRAELDRLRSRIMELEKGLKPFADYGAFMADAPKGHEAVIDLFGPNGERRRITYGDLRAASRLLTEGVK